MPIERKGKRYDKSYDKIPYTKGKLKKKRRTPPKCSITKIVLFVPFCSYLNMKDYSHSHVKKKNKINARRLFCNYIYK